MAEVQKLGFGYTDDNDESLQTKMGGKFGLNAGAFITKAEYNPNAGKDGAPSNAIDFTVAVGDKEFRHRVYEITGNLFKNSEQIAPDAEGYTALYNAEWTQRSAVVSHFIKATGVTDAQLKAVLSQNIVDFAGYAQAVCSLVTPAMSANPIDIFIEYQWKIKGDNNRTFLVIPANMKGGRFLCASVPATGAWKPVHDAKGMHYADDKGARHPFDRSTNYMESPKANQQIEGEEPTTNGGAANATPPTATAW